MEATAHLVGFLSNLFNDNLTDCCEQTQSNKKDSSSSLRGRDSRRSNQIPPVEEKSSLRKRTRSSTGKAQNGHTKDNENDSNDEDKDVEDEEMDEDKSRDDDNSEDGSVDLKDEPKGDDELQITPLQGM